MVAQKGRNYLVKINTTGSTYVAIGGMQEPSIEFDNDPVDVTNADSSGIRELLEGGGVSSVTIKGKGIFKDEAAVALMRTTAQTNVHKNFQFVIPGDTPLVLQGEFMVSKFTDSATYKEAGAYDFQLESSGPVTTPS